MSVDLWSQHILPAEGAIAWRAPGVEILAWRHSQDWLVAMDNKAPSTNAPEVAPVAIPKRPDTRRWAFNSEVPAVTFRPALPSRPLVVRPRTPLELPPQTEATFYVSLPLGVELRVGKPEAPVPQLQVLTTLEPVVLSDTWCGEFTTGELCFSLKSRAVRSLGEIQVRPLRAMCPLVIRNGSAAVLPLKKLCLRMIYLSLYRGQASLWTNRILLTYKGREELGQVDYETSAPGEAQGALLLVEASQRPPTGLARLTFGLSELTGAWS